MIRSKYPINDKTFYFKNKDAAISFNFIKE